MRVIFAGTPEFAAFALTAILEAGHDVPLVLTQPDRPAGRGQKLQPSAVKQVALNHGLRIHQPERLKDPDTHQPLIEAAGDVMVVAAYGLILPQSVLDIPRRGCLNIHASLLPRWRGAAPIHRAIEAGDRETGITIMKMEAGLDTGPMLLRSALPIEDGDSTGSLHDKLCSLGASLVVEALNRLDLLEPVPQPTEGVTYAKKIEKVEARLDWRLSAETLARRIRAFNPYPGAVCHFGELIVKVWVAIPVPGEGSPGEVLGIDENGIRVACGEGSLLLTELQKPGARRLPASDFLHGNPLVVGAVLD